MSDPATPSDGETEGQGDSVERHASWLELFFDLVVVVAVAQLAHLLAGHGGAHATVHDMIEFVVLYLAIWLLWLSFTLYANVAGEATRYQSMIVGMAGIAVMAAAIPEATGERGRVFALAYILTRVASTRSWGRTGKVLLTWTAAQRSAGLVPWIVSLWVEQPAQFRLWIAGVVIDLWFSVASGRDPDRAAQRYTDVARRHEQRAWRRGRLPEVGRFRLTFVEPDRPHLGERLGLFVIIVLGEAVAQIVSIAAGTDWTWQLVGAGTAGFLLVIGMWGLSFEYGFGSRSALPTALLLPAHFAAIASITSVAAGIGMAVTHPTEHLPAVSRAVLCGGVSVFLFAVALFRAPRRGLPIQLALVALPAVPAALGWALSAGALPWLLVPVIGGQLAYFRWALPADSAA
ncbi:MAG TPA: low temperature requirement protein A [Streptosporangiaceae bacterium]